MYVGSRDMEKADLIMKPGVTLYDSNLSVKLMNAIASESLLTQANKQTSYLNESFAGQIYFMYFVFNL